MAGIIDALNAGKTSLNVNQKAIEIVGNNISNVNVDGYSRQDAQFSTYPAISFGDFFIGQGVKVSDITRNHNVFIENQLQDRAVDYGYQEALTDPLAELEGVFNVTEDNLATEMDKFFDTLQELSANPNDLVQRNNVIQQGNILATNFNNTVEELDGIQTNLNESLLSGIDTLNARLAEVASLNSRIYGMEVQGQSANSTRDQRDTILKDLARTVGAHSCENENGMVAVHLPGGLPLVSGDMAMNIEADTTGTNVELILHAGGTKAQLSVNEIGGRFKGILEMRDNFVAGLEADLDKLAYELSTQVNIQHMTGGGLDSSTGNLFFSKPPNYVQSPPAPPPTAAEYRGAARGMGVVITDPKKIAAGAAPASGTAVAPGDNSNALALSNIGDTYLIDGADTFTALYGKMAATVGIESNQNQLSLKGARDSLTQLQNFRDGLVGVSLDEEMIDLIQYQRGFESSAQFITTIDEMMSTLLDMRR